MRAFKHISPKENAKVAKVFPHAHGYEWEEVGIYTAYPVSLWDKWAHEITDNVDDLLWGVTKEEEARRERCTINLSKEIVSSFSIYKYNERRKCFKRLASLEQLLEDIERQEYLPGDIFIPEIRAIYREGHDYTAWFFMEDESALDAVKNMVKRSGLKFIGSQNT
ncbi:hypothetical protein [Microbulbifer pacificus]|uniref:hypothetical protein n=1 Tax=Microbulbifer pacificus TaxID=407164 RepID=UPI000CF4C910|nr:hypothetical protein [Microbulbifer pacificus]